MRALELLAFAPLSAPKLATALGADPRTVRRLLSRLEEDGYVTCSNDARRVYQPTMRLVALAGQVVENSTLARRARPYVTLLHEQTRGAAHLVVPSYQSVLCLVHQASDADEVRPRLRELVPAHCTAGGKALLAWRARWRESVLSAPLERQTDRTIVDPQVLRRQLEAIRVEGFATEDGELQAEVLAVAAPVVVGAEAVAALTASGRDLDVAASAARVVGIAGELSDELRDGHS
jgi:DNA-binding IclR family transcriptional regulator